MRYCRPSNYTLPGYLDIVFQEHKEIYNAIMEKDTTAAVIAMMDHMNNSVKRRSMLIEKDTHL
ncbi:MAG: FCD domain-containing protein [Clostridia bacterium]|nr:FCD domain-containing protein [Clostridia bacterium]